MDKNLCWQSVAAAFINVQWLRLSITPTVLENVLCNNLFKCIVDLVCNFFGRKKHIRSKLAMHFTSTIFLYYLIDLYYQIVGIRQGQILTSDIKGLDL